VHRFNTTSQLIAWLESEQRQKLITEVKAQFGDDAEVDYPDTLAGFSAWFERPADPQSTKRPPPTWKQSLIVLVALYPIILILGILVPGLIPTAHPLTTRLLVAAVAVALMGFLVVPGLARLLSPWIHSRRFWPQVGGAAGLIGVLLVIWLASLEIMPGPDDEKSHPSRPLPVDAEHQRNRE
jgi:antibiotic biosynthesis monooxygenase (ABM) superfamily enzyme